MNVFDQVTYDLHVSTSYRFPPDSTTVDSNLTVSEHKATLDYGVLFWKVKAKDNWGAERWCSQTGHVIVSGLYAIPLGDVNRDGFIDLRDVVFSINYLYRSGSSPNPKETGDVNCDGVLDIGDVVFLINYLFRGGPEPAC